MQKRQKKNSTTKTETLKKYIKKDISSNIDKENYIICKSNCDICNLESFLSATWYDILKKEVDTYFPNLKKQLHNSSEFYPAVENIFIFSKFFDLKDTKVVIIGQDPYHGDNQAMGLSFSVPKTAQIPPSLKNIYKEVKNCYESFQIPKNGCLKSWAEQGVLLLNHTLTVIKNKPGSHSHLNWKNFTSSIISKINVECKSVVFMLWGNYAKTLESLINEKKHMILKSSHPSPFSVNKGFFGSKHFLEANLYLKNNQKDIIKW